MRKKHISFLTIITVFALIVATNYTNTYAADSTSIAINEENFPDIIFRDYIIENYDSDNNLELSESEISNLTTIILNYQDVASVKGIEFFYNLDTLFLSGTQIEEVNLSNNTKLKNLDLYNSKLKEIDLSNNRELVYLDLTYTNIDEIDLTNNTNINLLYLSFTNIDTLDVSNLLNLQGLVILNTKISELNLSNNILLNNLTVSGTQISELDLEKNVALEQLYISNSHITKLKLPSDVCMTSIGIENQQYKYVLKYKKTDNGYELNLKEQLGLTDYDLENISIQTENLTLNKETGVVSFEEELTQLEYLYAFEVRIAQPDRSSCEPQTIYMNITCELEFVATEIDPEVPGPEVPDPEVPDPEVPNPEVPNSEVPNPSEIEKPISTVVNNNIDENITKVESNVPETGDYSNTLIYVAPLIVAGALIIILVSKKRK